MPFSESKLHHNKIIEEKTIGMISNNTFKMIEEIINSGENFAIIIPDEFIKTVKKIKNIDGVECYKMAAFLENDEVINESDQYRMYDPKKFGAFIDRMDEKTEFEPDNFESIITQIKLEDPDKWNKLSKEIPNGILFFVDEILFNIIVIYFA